MSNDLSETSGVPKEKRTLAYDTGALPPKKLTEEEIEILHGINDLIEKVWKRSNSSTNRCGRRAESVWADPEEDRRNNVIMIDGVRGAGKTSLLNTLLKGWNRPEFFNPEDLIELKKEFEKMRGIVRALKPIDFDPLPPDLPIYNWIIQAFDPLVQMVGGESALAFTEPPENEEIDDTLSGKYRALHHAAAVGWTAGMLRQELKTDGDDFLLWQREQQLNWQALQSMWQQFLDKLLQKLQDASPTDPNDKLPRGGIIVLPIDDLDLQAERTRELLLAIRVLRHDRLAYILTGDTKGTDLALIASFHREFTGGTMKISGEFLDTIEKSTQDLGPKLRQKTIPSSQIFKIGGLNIEDVKKWSPHKDGQTMDAVLDDLWVDTGDTDPQKFSEFLCERCTNDTIKLPFRALQNFVDRWNGKSGDNEGVAEFLKIAIENPMEEANTVGVEGGEGSHPGGEKYIEISSAPGDVAPSPRPPGIIRTRRTGAQIKWAKRLDFVRREENKDPSENPKFESASPQLLLALDLEAWCRSRFVFVNNTRLVKSALGLVWTEYEEKRAVMPWPMINIPNFPSQWIDRCNEWSSCLAKYSKDSDNPTQEELLKAWCSFNSGLQPQAKESLEYHLGLKAIKNNPDFKVFSSDHIGLDPDLSRRVRHVLAGEEAARDYDDWVRKNTRKREEITTEFAPYLLAFAPERGTQFDPTKEM
ncbi:MAG: hypothetical protein F4X19_14160 [Acidobacteria bacterium]|nr:hypothetical protein [Acidobacteriota bacterium]